MDFPQEKELNAETVQLDTALFRYPFRIRIEGDKAIVLDLHGVDNYYHLFQYPGFRYLSSFGKRGDSPDEMLSAENLRYIKGTIWTLDANKGELNRFVSSSSGDSLLREEVVSLDKSLLRSLDFACYNDSTFIIPDYSGDNRFCWVHRDGHLIKRSGTIPSTNEDALAHARPIYAVFHGRTFKEISKQKEPIIDGGRYIYVFSLQGEPLCKYTLDRYIYGIHVDEGKKIITATDVNDDQPIVEFRIG